jgi:hypothetical protein
VNERAFRRRVNDSLNNSQNNLRNSIFHDRPKDRRGNQSGGQSFSQWKVPQIFRPAKIAIARRVEEKTHLAALLALAIRRKFMR